jgi:hypothetical protein
MSGFGARRLDAAFDRAVDLGARADASNVLGMRASSAEVF